MLNFILAAALSFNFAPQIATIIPEASTAVNIAQEPQGNPIIQVTSVEVTQCKGKGATMPFGATGTVVVMFPPSYASYSYDFTVYCDGSVSVSPSNLESPELDAETLAQVENVIWSTYFTL